MQVEMELWHIKCGELPLTGQDTTVQHSTSQDTTVQHSTLHDIHTVHICTVLISWGPDKFLEYSETSVFSSHSTN